MAQLSLFLVVLFALIVPILMARLKVNAVPTAVAEIIIGIILGASRWEERRVEKECRLRRSSSP